MRLFPFFILSFLFISCSTKQPKTPGGLSPVDALKSFQLPEDFQIELIAAEPMVADPVAMEVDANGNIYVVEMHGYPLDTKGSGVIKILTDTDSDGFPDKTTVFADGLILPNGIQCWKKGVILTDVPDVLYLEDTNRDNIADVREVILTGFARSNPQHNANSPLLGLDNWIYIAHEDEVSTKFFEEQFGDVGTDIRFPGREGTPTLPRNANGRSVRFKPDTYQLEMLSGDSQFGHTFSPYGEHINTSNAQHLFHEVLAAQYLERNPAVQVTGVSQDLPDHGNAAEVFPITKNPEHQLLTDVGVITSSCGVTWYGGGLFPDNFSNVTFIAEPVHNLVHADVLKQKGASFVAGRLYNDREFLASTDSWSRPVNFYNGPDGALYVIDYYRQIIEHPEWMSEEVTKSGALYNGSDMGRIYRITPKGTTKLSWNGKLNLNEATDEDLVSYLDHASLWWRKTAQRILVERNSSTTKALLKKFLEGEHTSVGAVHALWVMEGMDNSDPEIILKALNDAEPGVRVNAIRISELHLQDMLSLGPALISMQDDGDARVRYQLLCTLGFLKGEEALNARIKILEQDVDDPWISAAALSAVRGAELSLIEKSLKNLSTSSSDGKLRFYESAGAVIGRSQNAPAIEKVINLALKNINSETSWWKAALLRGLQNGLNNSDAGAVLSKQRAALLKTFSESTPDELRRSALSLTKLITGFSPSEEKKYTSLAKTYSLDRDKPLALREDAIQLLSFFPTKENEEIAIKLLSPDEPESIQRRAIQLYKNISSADASAYLTTRWNEFTPSLRYDILGNMMRDTIALQKFLQVVEDKKINPSTISWPQTVGLMNHANKRIREWSRQMLASESLSENELLQKYAAALEGKGSVVKGKVIFEKSCSSCHQINNSEGVAFGPDLGTIRNRDSRFILLDIINPDRAIADGYELWNVHKKSGEEHAGVISAQTSSSITLRTADGKDQIIARNDIEKLSSITNSAMPQGLASGFTTDELRDLIYFLKSKN